MKSWRASTAGLGLAAVIVTITAVLVFATSNDWVEFHIPGAAHVAGSNNTAWRTDLEIRSVSTAPAQVRIDLLRKNQNNTNYPAVVVNIDAGSAQRFEDALDLLFDFEGSATLRLTTMSGEVRATSRTYNLTSGGTYGQFIGGSGLSDAFEFTRDATLIQLSSSPDRSQGFRTNIGLVNLVGFPTNMEIALFHADTRYLGTIETTLQPYEYDQIDDAFGEVTSETIEDGFVVVRATTYGAVYLTYASVIDNRTGDPIYIPGLADGSDSNRTPTPGTPTTTPTISSTPTATLTPVPIDPVVVTTTDDETYNLLPTSIRFIVGNGIQTSLVLCNADGALSQVASSNFSFIRGPTQTVEWSNCCANFGARLEYETWVGIGGPAVARSTCTAGTPVFAISGTDVDTGESIEINGEVLDLAIWP